jgi:hypothetical protein
MGVISRRTPVKRSRGKRRGPFRSVAYRRWVASHPCQVCGNPETQACHTVTGGMSMKSSDATCVPLCPRHHREFDSGRAKFDQKYCVDMFNVSVQLFALWEEKNGKVAA